MKLLKNKLMVGVILLAFMAGIVFTGGILFGTGHLLGNPVLASLKSQESSKDALPGVGPNTISDIVARAGPAVIKIETTSVNSGRQSTPLLNDPFFREFFGGQGIPQAPQEQKALGSGFIISQDGYILTNQHVVEGAQDIQVTIVGQLKPLKARLVGSDRDLDLAVLKVDLGNNLPYLKLGDSDQIAVGNWVIAIGNPYGLDHTVTVGVISAKGRPITVEDRSYRNLLQTDASINPGNSGGPLINLKGEVIGINTAVSAQAQGIGFAIPCKTVNGVLQDLINTGKVKRGWLGVEIQEVTPSVANYFGLPGTEGVVIRNVVAGGPAAKVGLQQGDIITEWDGAKLSGTDNLLDKIQKAGPGGRANLSVWRQRHQVKIPVTLSERPS